MHIYTYTCIYIYIHIYTQPSLTTQDRFLEWQIGYRDRQLPRFWKSWTTFCNVDWPFLESMVKSFIVSRGRFEVRLLDGAIGWSRI